MGWGEIKQLLGKRMIKISPMIRIRNPPGKTSRPE
jgi:hypothetical protein